MKSMSEVLEKKSVKIGGIRQNCYALDVRERPQAFSQKAHTMTKYPSLEVKKLPNGYIEQVEMKDYPINAESISSYADGADYRRDPMSAIQNAPKRVNLGDITETQKFIETNPQDAVKILRNVQKSLESYLKNLQSEPPKGEGEGEDTTPPAQV